MTARALAVFVALLMTALMVMASSCNCGPDVTVGSGGGSGGSGGSGNGQGGSGNGQGGSGGSGNGQGGSGGGVFNPDSGCAAVTSEANLGSRPMDIIMVIDNSGSMTEEIVGVQDNINANFASILNDGGLDYRVVLLARHGSPTVGQSICIAPPLSGNATCTPPPANPTNGPKFFHYNVEVSSTNALQLVTSRYNIPDLNMQPAAGQGYSQWLRSNAFKTIVVITDDNSSVNPTNFENALFALTPAQFGTAANRNYKLHSIIGLPYKASPAAPYLPTEPVAAGTCPSGVNNGSNYQPLSITTGGLRFPVCDPSKYNAVFQAIAEGVIAGARAACEFAIPPPPAGFTMFNKIIVNYTPGGGGTAQSFTKVANLAACGATNYYVDNNRIFLCPQVCTVVQADMQAKVDVIFTCEPEIG